MSIRGRSQPVRPLITKFVTPAVASNVVTFDATSNSGYQVGFSSYSFNVDANGSNRYLIVAVGIQSVGGSVSSITRDGQSFTLLGSVTSVGACRSELWGLLAPNTGTKSCTVTLSSAITSAATATSWTNVDQTTPSEGFNSASGMNFMAADATVDATTTADKDVGG